ncbi:MAG TPA: hypothetical protein VM490_25360, partial [Armatimonadaceae bacterium]|nr:hypothetical protein [Armatimonadaceae bacterium]
AVDTDASFLPRLWASRKIGHLMDDLRLRDDGEVKKEIVEQIVALSKEYGILTPYTAMFVPEPGQEMAGRRADGIISNDADNSLLFGGSRGVGAMKGAPAGPAGGFGGAAASSPVPAARSGEAAVNASQGARSQRAANQVGNYNVYALKAGQEKSRDEALSKRIQNVASRTFYQVGPVWRDATFDEKKQKEVVKVKLYSPAYFALTRRNAAFAKWAALGDQVLITANASQAVQFGSEGRESLTEKELDALAGKG